MLRCIFLKLLEIDADGGTSGTRATQAENYTSGITGLVLEPEDEPLLGCHGPVDWVCVSVKN